MASIRETRAVNSLYRMALKALTQRVSGYMLEESKKTYTLSAEGQQILKDEVLIRKEIGPDLSAILFVLTNVAPAQWRMKPDEGPLTAPDSDPGLDLNRLSEQALRELEKLCHPS